MDPDPGGPKTRVSGSGSATLARAIKGKPKSTVPGNVTAHYKVTEQTPTLRSAQIMK